MPYYLGLVGPVVHVVLSLAPTGKQVAVEENETLRQIRAILRGNIEEIVARKVADDVEDAAGDTKRPTEDDSKQGDRVGAKK